MNLQTIRTVASELGVSEITVRRAAAAGKLDAVRVGNRLLVDLDTARPALRPFLDRASIEDVSRATGLSVSAIRRGIHEGWIPCTKPGKAYVFDLDEVETALRERMTER